MYKTIYLSGADLLDALGLAAQYSRKLADEYDLGEPKGTLCRIFNATADRYSKLREAIGESLNQETPASALSTDKEIL